MTYSLSQGGLATRRASDVKVVRTRGRRSVTARARQRELELKLATLQKDYAELHGALIEAAQVYRRLCAPHLVRYGDFEIASETFAVRHVPGDFFTIEETPTGVVLALGDICGKGLAAGMWTTHLVGLASSRTAVFPEPRAIASGWWCGQRASSVVLPWPAAIFSTAPGKGLAVAPRSTLPLRPSKAVSER